MGKKKKIEFEIKMSFEKIEIRTGTQDRRKNIDGLRKHKN